MLTESIAENRPLSQPSKFNTGTIQKAPSTGYFKIDLQSAWVDLIKRYEPYAWFVTLTFKEPRHPESSDKAFYRWIRYLNESLYGRRYRDKKIKKGVTWVKCMEYQKRDVIHFHCLVGSPDMYKLKRLDFMKAWETDCNRKKELVNGYARIYEYDPFRGAVSYCSKYVLKGGEVDIQLSPELFELVHNKEPKLDLQFIN